MQQRALSATESFESILSEARKYRLNLILANQFMTQLTDKIREALLGNVGTLMSGRIGVTDAELMEKAFSPVFNAEDLHKQPNFNWIATVMMFDTPTSPFTMKSLPPMGEDNDELMKRMKTYALSKYGRPRAEVEAEIDARLAASNEQGSKEETPVAAPAAVAPVGGAAAVAANIPKPAAKPKKNFLDSWLEKKAKLEKKSREEAVAAMNENKAAAPKGPFKKKPVPAPPVEKPKPIQKAAEPVEPVASTAQTAPAPAPASAAQPVAPVSKPVAPAPKPATAAPAKVATPKVAAPAAKKPAPVPAPAPTPAPAPAPDPTSIKIEHDPNARKLKAAEELTEMSTGSAWTSVATENAAGTTVEENKKATDDFMKADARIKIQHEPRQVLNVSQHAVTAPVAAQPVATTKQANTSDSKAAKDDEDGTVLRWR